MQTVWALFLCSGKPLEVAREGRGSEIRVESGFFLTMSLINPPAGLTLEQMGGPPRKSASSSKLRLNRFPGSITAALLKKTLISLYKYNVISVYMYSTPGIYIYFEMYLSIVYCYNLLRTHSR